MQAIGITSPIGGRSMSTEFLKFSDQWQICAPDVGFVDGEVYCIYPFRRYIDHARHIYESVSLLRRGSACPVSIVDVLQTLDFRSQVYARYELEPGWLVMKESGCVGGCIEPNKTEVGVVYTPHSVDSGHQIYFPEILSYEGWQNKLANPPERRQIFTIGRNYGEDL